MGRTKGTYTLTSNIEPKVGAPLDARTIVKLLADLTASNTFEYPYKGMRVFVEENNKSYTLVGSDPTVSTNWIEDNSGGHTIKNPAGTAMTQRSNLQFVDLTVSDDSTNDATKVESVHVIQSESELANLPDGLYMLNEDEDTVIDGNLVGYDNTTSGLNADNVQDAVDEVNDALDDKADKVSGATNGNLAGLDANGNLTDSGVAASEIPELWKSQGEYGVKNLISYPYIQSTKTQNGITFTSYSDGSVLVNGTATNDANFEVLRKSDDSLGGYWMTGGKSTKLLMRQRIVAKSGGAYIRDRRDTGSGIALDNIDTSTEMYYILVYVVNGTSINNETIYPMIRLASDTDDTYRPYAKTNKQLTDEVGENTEDIDTLENRADNTTTSISGNPISISGLKANQLAVNPIITLEPIQDLHGQSKPYPAGGGKNKYGSGDVSGTQNVTVNLSIPAGTYTISAVCTSSDTDASTCLALVRYTDTIYHAGVQLQRTNRSSATLVLAKQAASITFYASDTNAHSSGDTFTVKSIQIEEGTQATDYAPYENICPISGYDKVEVLSCGKNLFDKDNLLVGIVIANGSISTSNESWRRCYFPVVPNTNYCINMPGYSTFSGYTYATYDKDGVWLETFANIGSVPATITTGSNVYYIAWNCNTTNADVIQIEEGSSATTYVPYHKTTSISESLGQTVYGGTLDVRTGKFTVEFVKRVYDGSSDESWIKSTNAFYIAAHDLIKVFDYANSIKCDKLQLTSYFNIVDGSITNAIAGYRDSGGAYPGQNWFYIGIDGISDVTSLKTWLSNNPIEVVYELATPTEIQLTPHEISLLKDYAYVSTNGTTIALDYHNGELASLADVSQLGETVNELGEFWKSSDSWQILDATQLSTTGVTILYAHGAMRILTINESPTGTSEGLILTLPEGHRPHNTSGGVCLIQDGSNWRIGMVTALKNGKVTSVVFNPNTSTLSYANNMILYRAEIIYMVDTP